MISPDEILQILTRISNDARFVAIAWHIIIGIFIIALVVGWRLQKRLTGILVALPLLSVSGASWLYGNPFNAATFFILAILAILFALKLPANPVSISPPLFAIPGVILTAFGLIYPHFLNDASLLIYAYSAPVGLVPCPTLSVIIGILLLLDGLRSRAYSLTLAIGGLFYGAFGSFRLHVYIDLILVAGSIFLLTQAIRKLRIQ